MENVHFLDSGKKALGEILLGLKKVDQKTLDAALDEQKRLNTRLGEVLVKNGTLTQKELDYALALQKSHDPNAPMIARKKLGDLLLETGKISPAQLQAALQQQALSQKKIGEVLIEMGFVTQKDLDSAVNLQDSLAFSSRNSVLQKLQAENVGATVRKPEHHATGKLDQAFATRSQFLDAVLPQAFQSAFGRVPSGEETAQFKHKAEFLFGNAGKLSDPLPLGFNLDARQRAVDKLDTYFQNVIADRVTQLVGGDLVHKQFDAEGHVDVVGLSQVDLEIALEIATLPGFDLAHAQKEFLERSPRALFRAALGRDFASQAEEAFYDRALEGPQAAQAKRFLQMLHQSIDRAYAPYHISRNDKALQAQLVLTEDELREALAIFRQRHMDHFHEAFVSSDFFLRKLKIADRAEAVHGKEMASIKVKQLLKKLMQLLQQLMGSIPPKLAGKIAALAAKLESGNLSEAEIKAIEQMLQQLIAQIMQVLQSLGGAKGADPSTLLAAIEAMIDGLLGGGPPGGGLGEGKKVAAVAGMAGGGVEKAGMSLEEAIAVVNQLNFDFNGIVDFGADAQNPMVKALCAGMQSPQTLNASFAAAHDQGLVAIPTDRAVAFVAHLNEQFRGVRGAPDADDQWVRKIVAGEMTPGEVARHFRSVYQAAPTADDAPAAPSGR
ncbi:MAG: hypothetical protein FJZ01_03515 [Candidatus Sericytochromatia bacterium]|nr:hypothetical protein [Candidatus Tanganyikabacteria bacterium]